MLGSCKSVQKGSLMVMESKNTRGGGGMKFLKAFGFPALGLLCLLLSGSAAYAQSSTPRVNDGDILHVEVEVPADISGDFTGAKGGTITLPSIGRVAATGRTTSEIGTDLARRMSLISSKITQVTVTMAQ